MTESDRLIDGNANNGAGDDKDVALRPKSLDGFIGQKKGRENLSVFIQAAQKRGDAMGIYSRACQMQKNLCSQNFQKKINLL